MENLIKTLRDRLDLIEEEADFDIELTEEITLLLETSELIKSLGNWDDDLEQYKDEQGVKLAKYLHEKYRVSDQAKLVPYTHNSGNLSLMSFKGHYDNFIVLRGPNGWAAFKPKEEYLRKKLENPRYKPSTDKSLKYVGVFSLEQPSENATPLQKGKTFFATTIEGTRGGRYDRPEKKEVTAKGIVTISDQLKDHIGKKGVTVYRLMERDPEEIKKIDPRMLMGRRSGDIPTTASVQRRKIDIRRSQKTDNELLKQINEKISKVKNRLLKKIELRRIRKGDKNNSMIKKLKSDPTFYKETFLPGIIQELFLYSDLESTFPQLNKKVEDYKKKYNDTSTSSTSIILRLAAGEDPTVWTFLLEKLRQIFENRIS